MEEQDFGGADPFGAAAGAGVFPDEPYRGPLHSTPAPALLHSTPAPAPAPAFRSTPSVGPHDSR